MKWKYGYFKWFMHVVVLYPIKHCCSFIKPYDMPILWTVNHESAIAFLIINIINFEITSKCINFIKFVGFLCRNHVPLIDLFHDWNAHARSWFKIWPKTIFSHDSKLWNWNFLVFFFKTRSPKGISFRDYKKKTIWVSRRSGRCKRIQLFISFGLSSVLFFITI